MNWPKAIDQNRGRLLRIIVALVASLGLSEGGVLTVLPRFLYRRAMLMLVPAETAVRCLIIMAAYELELRGVRLRLLPRVRTTFTNFMLLNAPSHTHVPAFALVDPRKQFGLEPPDYAQFGRSFDEDPDAEIREPADRTPVPAASLGRRLLALKAALENLPKQARRLARWYGQRDAAYANSQPHLYSPIRPGLPRGYRRRGREEIDVVMLDCHSLAQMARDRRDSP